MTDDYTKRRGPRPHVWVYPHDKEANKKHLARLRSLAQAKFRGEEWTITEEEWMTTVWPKDLWLRRGRNGEDLCLIRWDAEKAWSKDNVYIVTRRTQLVLQKHPDAEIKEVEPGVWDIVGEALERHLKNRAKMSKYYERYKKEKRR